MALVYVVLTVAALASTTLLAPACGEAPPTPRELIPITVAPTTLPGSAPIFVAREQGFFREAGLDATVRTYAAGRLALADLLAGKVDVAMVADTPIARSALDGRRPVVLATVDEIEGANYIVARKDRGITKATDLSGKRLGLLQGTSADYFQHVYLVTSGIDPRSVSLVPLDPDELVPALAQGRVDAISAFEPYTVQAEDTLGDNATVLANPRLYTTTWNVTVRGETTRADRETMVRFLRAIARAKDFIESNPSEAQRITSRGTGIPAAALRRTWAANRWTLSLDQTLILTLEDEARWMTGGSGDIPDFLRHIDTAPLKQVRPEGVTIVEPKD